VNKQEIYNNAYRQVIELWDYALNVTLILLALIDVYFTIATPQEADSNCQPFPAKETKISMTLYLLFSVNLAHLIVFIHFTIWQLFTAKETKLI